MTTDFTRREIGKLAGTGALVMSAASIGRSTSATEATAGSIRGAQAASQIGEQRTVTNAVSDAAMQRADELLRKVTIEEKIMQLSAVMPFVLLGPEGPIRSQLDVSGPGLFGYKTPEVTAKTINAIQRYLVTETRLGIPAIFHNEALNGVVSAQFTHFPTAIGLAATWDPDAVEEMADLMRRQMRSVGLLQALAPVMDVARDARWGRVHETYGEDPYLVTAMSVAFTRGMQGDDLRAGVLASAKHFLGYAVTEAGQNMAATAVGERELYDVYARPFEAAIRLAGLGSVMASYSEFDGVPIHISKEVLTELLRGRMGFTGTVVSDYVGVGWARTRQGGAASDEEVGALALAAGMDIELPQVQAYGPVLIKAVGSGMVSESVLDESVRRALRDKFALGLFDEAYVPEDPVRINAVAAEGDDLSRRLAAESVTLLKNDDNLLPLRRDIQKIAMIGPYADSTAVGFPAYTYPAALQQLRGRASGAGETSMAGVESGEGAWLPPEVMAAMNAAMQAELQDVMSVEFEEWIRSSYPAASLADAVRRLLPDAKVTAVAGTGVVPSEPTDIPAAVAAANSADTVVLYVCGKSAWFGSDVTEGEGKDAANIDLPPQQVELVNAVTAVGKPTVAVVSMGRVLRASPPSSTACRPCSPPITVDRTRGSPSPTPSSGSRIPAESCRSRSRATSGRRRSTMARRPAAGTGGPRRHPQGLSRHAVHAAVRLRPRTQLHDLRLRPLELESDTVDVGAEARLSLSVSNTGDRRGTEVVQLYAADTATGVTLPAQQLIGFARLDLEPGASKTIRFAVPMSLLGYTGLSGDFVMEPGPVEVSAGSSSTDIRSSATLTVTGQTRSIRGQDRAFLSVATVAS